MKLLESKLTTACYAQLEQIESSYWMKYYQQNGSLKTNGSVYGGAFAGAVPGIDLLALNRVIGLGLSRKIDQNILNEIIDFYRKAGTRRFFLQLIPEVADAYAQSLLSQLDFKHYNNWLKLGTALDRPVDLKANPLLSIRKIDTSEARLYGQLIFMSFDWEDSRLPSWLASVVGSKGYSHYIVSYRKKAVAAGALFTEGSFGSMAFAGTLPQFRGLGAQTLLLKTRMEDARQAGVNFLTAETAQQQPGKPVKSYQNLIKAGFNLVYERQNWIYEFPQ